jgi:hypothetical protein
MMQPTPNSTTPNSNEDFYTFFTNKLFGTGKDSFLDTAFKSLKPEAEQLLNTFGQIDSEAIKVAKSFGQGRENVLSIKKTLVDAAPAIEALGGKFEDVARIQEDIVKTLNRAVLLSSESFSKLYETEKVTGQGVEKLLPAFKDVGISAYGVAEGMQKIVDTARQQGLSVLAVSSQAVSNMESMNKYNFQGGVDGLAKMAAQASSLRIDMSKTLTFAEDLYNPEKAIDMAASLQRLGVAQSDLLDPLRLMDLSLNDPTELQNQLVQMTQQFVELNEAGQFEIAPQGKLQLREISKATGLAYEDLTKMALGSAELEDKLTKIRFPEIMTEDQQKMIANLAEMKDGEYVITLDGKETKLAEAFEGLDTTEQLNKLIAASEPKTMEELTREQLSIDEAMRADIEKIKDRVARGLASSEVGEEAANALTAAVKGLTDAVTDKGVLSSESFRDLADKQAGPIGDVLTKLMSGNMDALGDLSLMGENFKEFGTTTLDGLKANLQEQYAKMSESQNAYAKVSTNLIDNLNNFVKTQTGVDLLSKVSSPADASVNKSTEAGKTETGRVEEKTINTSSTVDVNIKLEVPPGMSESEVKKALGTESIIQEIVKIIETKYPDLKSKPD